jgi:hypothetical protein
MEVLLLLSLGSVEPRRRVQEAAMEALDPAVYFAPGRRRAGSRQSADVDVHV